MTKPNFTVAAINNIREAGIEWEDDLFSIQTKTADAETLLALCLDGADFDRSQGWVDYVSALVEYAAARPLRTAGV